MEDLLEKARRLSRTDLGAWGEQCACNYLRTQGYRILDRNWRGRGGELDIVALDPAREAVVTVEVKTRRAARTGELRAGTPEEAVTEVKLRRLRSLLWQWTIDHQVPAKRIGVDVIGVVLKCGRFAVNHVKDVY